MTQTTVVSRFRCGANTKLPSFIGGVYSFSVNTCVNHNNTFGRVCGFFARNYNWIGICRFQDCFVWLRLQMGHNFCVCWCYQWRQIDCRLFCHKIIYFTTSATCAFDLCDTRYRFASFQLVIYVRFRNRNSSITDITMSLRCDVEQKTPSIAYVSFSVQSLCRFGFGIPFFLELQSN